MDDPVKHARMQQQLDVNGFIRLLRSEVKRAGSQAAFARKAGVDRTTVNQVLSGRLSPPAKLVHALNLRAVLFFLPK